MGALPDPMLRAASLPQAPGPRLTLGSQLDPLSWAWRGPGLGSPTGKGFSNRGQLRVQGAGAQTWKPLLPSGHSAVPQSTASDRLPRETRDSQQVSGKAG